MKKWFNKNKIFLIGMIVVLISSCMFKIWSTHILTKNEVNVCIHETFIYEDYIRHLYRSKEVKISGNVNMEALGQYQVIYTIKDKQETLMVNVVDKLNPEFDLYEKTIVLGEEIEAKELVYNIKDDSKVNIFYAKEYDFSSSGDYPVKVVVEDDYGNKTIKETVIHVEEKDTIPPVMKGLNPLIVEQGTAIDYYSGVSVTDNQDPNPTFTIDFNDLKENVPGSYEIYYMTIDRQGNSAIYTRTVTVKKISETQQKVVYLTIDDGPSYNTPEILEILNRYNAKATFFVTGECPEYYSYIKIAHDLGHTIGMHTYCHNYSTIYSSDQAYIEDLNAISDVVEQQIGYRPNIFRFPGGSSNTVSRHYNLGIISRLVDYANRNGWIYYDWNADIGDGNSGMESQDLIDRAVESGKGINRIVMLMHDGRGSQESVKALPTIIEYYQSLGYEFKAIDENAPTAHHKIAN